MIHNFDVFLSSACNPFAILGGIVQIKKIDFLFSLTSLLRRSLFELKTNSLSVPNFVIIAAADYVYAYATLLLYTV